MKKIAILGANSYIARNLICLLNKKGIYNITLYDYHDKHLDNETNYIKINILSAESVKKIDLNVDYIYMFIGKTGSANGFDEQDSFIDINERSLLNLLNEYRRQKSSARIVYPSTRLVYKGKRGKCKEEDEKEFKTIYAINKYACEKYLEMYHNAFGVDYVIFRICLPYGTLIPGATSYGTAEFMLKKARNNENILVYGDGEVRRTLTHMEDLCEILIRAVLMPQCLNDIYNIGGEEYSLLEMANLIALKYNVKVESVPWPELAYKIESGDTVFNSEKLDGIVGYTYKYNFHEWCENTAY